MLSFIMRLESMYGSILSRLGPIVSNTVIKHHSYQGWTNYCFMVFPSLLFLSTYSIVILFWAQVTSVTAAPIIVFPGVLCSHLSIISLVTATLHFFQHCSVLFIASKGSITLPFPCRYGVFVIISAVTFLLEAWHQYSQ